MKQMKLTLRKDGTQKLEVIGAVGDDCLVWTGEMERRLGKQEGERSLKPEFESTESEPEQERETER